MERTFETEIGRLRLGAGEIFHGEGILAIAKGLLQSGVAYVGGYQGAPVSHLLDVLVSARDLLDELGVQVSACTNEASAAAMLGASINYPVRGAVTWKSIVGTNVASDALSNLASAGVVGGALMVIGEDYGEGSSVIQERSYAYALKSSVALVDPEPALGNLVEMIERSFELSEASNMPVMMQLRIRACHLQGAFVARDNRRPRFGARSRLPEPHDFLYDRLSHPPVTFAQEKRKITERIPAACRFIRERGLNRVQKGRRTSRIGVIVPGGLFNSVIRQLGEMGLADVYGAADLDLLVLNVTYPLVPEEIADFARGKDHLLVVEEGHPPYMEQQILQLLVERALPVRLHGKDYLPKTGEYTGEVLCEALARFACDFGEPELDLAPVRARRERLTALRANAAGIFGGTLPARPPNFCTGCPERPVFGAIKLAERTHGRVHIAGDIGCHALATYEPFSLGNSILGYGLSLASNAAVAPLQERRPIAVMGDGGFWHNGLQTGVAGTLYNRGDGVLVIMSNGYASATGQQVIPSSARRDGRLATGTDIARTLRALGVEWIRTVRTYSVKTMVRALSEALTTAERGLKVIIADGECMLARQRREGAETARRLADGRRVVQERYGVDDALCTGDHSCIRLSGCPSLTVKPNPDPLRSDPVAHVAQDCVACGLCGEMAHAAALCPSFYRAGRVRNAGRLERLLHRLRLRVIGTLAGAP
ncbi:MAG TPA: indolepyruvate ferredoxin oxidoreductase subunit alpha [Kiloniellales bacterium]|nr:indolepyruvate ferredoxin oxidoreductase subunit alpha [Kiloniellales bacterium]